MHYHYLRHIQSLECALYYKISAMTVSTALVVMSYVVLAPSLVHSQIPTACADEESLRTLTCCPTECGVADGRGVCGDIDLPNHYSRTSSDARANWPHYFTHKWLMMS